MSGNMKSSKASLVFPSYIYQGALSSGKARGLNTQLTREIGILQKLDGDGVRWSKKNYVNGYSSYASMTQLHHTSPYFGELTQVLEPHLKKFVRTLQWDLLGRKVKMTTCWANSMGYGSHHTLHLHPYAVISGVYYVSTPSGSSPLKLEDPRMNSLMASPPRKANASPSTQPYVTIPAQAGHFVLFEGWMRHEVPPHRGAKPRLSISFNYEWT
jgi:uncharacterized protein (TIGR02466 family)